MSNGRWRNPKFESDIEVHTVVLLGKQEQVVGQRKRSAFMGLRLKVVRIRRTENLDDFEVFSVFCESPSLQTNPRFHNMIW